MQNTLIKTTQHTPSGSLSPELHPWQVALRERFGFIRVYDEIFKRFTHFHEIRISALIGSNWWSSGGTSGLIRDFILSHVWDGEKFIEVGVVPEIDVNMCFNNERQKLEDNNDEINAFLSGHGVDVSRTSITASSHRTHRSHRTHSGRKTHRSRSRSRDRDSSSESDSSRESTVSDDQPKSTMVRTYAVGPRHTRPTSKGGANTLKRKKYNKNKSKRRKRSSIRRRLSH
jgi:hypothetical protein